MTFAQIIAQSLAMNHVEDWKVVSSFALFLTSFSAANLMFYDVIRGKKRKLAGTVWHTVVIAQSVIFYTLATFGLARFLDGLQDVVFITENPNTVTTLSQQSLILELPLIGVSICILVFIGLYVYTYIKFKPHKNECHKTYTY